MKKGSRIISLLLSLCMLFGTVAMAEDFVQPAAAGEDAPVQEAQMYTFAGKVVNAEGEGMPGVTVRFRNTDKTKIETEDGVEPHAITIQDGTWKLEMPGSAYRLIFRYNNEAFFVENYAYDAALDVDVEINGFKTAVIGDVVYTGQSLNQENEGQENPDDADSEKTTPEDDGSDTDSENIEGDDADLEDADLEDEDPEDGDGGFTFVDVGENTGNTGDEQATTGNEEKTDSNIQGADGDDTTLVDIDDDENEDDDVSGGDTPTDTDVVDEPVVLLPPVLNQTPATITAETTEVSWTPAEHASAYRFAFEDVSDIVLPITILEEETDITAFALPLEQMTRGNLYMLTIRSVSYNEDGTETVSENPTVWRFTYVDTVVVEGADADAAMPSILSAGFMRTSFVAAAATGEKPVVGEVDGIGKKGAEIALAWTEVTGATKYDVYVGLGLTPPAAPTASDLATKTYGYTPAAIGTYSVKVKAKSDTDDIGESDVVTFVVTDSQFAARKAWVNGAASVYTNDADATKKADLADKTEVTIVGEGTRWQIKTLAGEYYFIDKASITETGPSKLNKPTGLAVVSTEDNPLSAISWTAQDTRTNKYQVVVLKGTTVEKTYEITVPVGGKTEFTYPLQFIYGTAYTVRICALPLTAANEQSDYLEISYTRPKPSNVTLDKPVFTGDIIYGYLLKGSASAAATVPQWNAVTGATSYEWVVNDTTGGNAIAVTQTASPQIAATLLAGLKDETQYRLSVRAKGTNSAVNPATDIYSEWVDVQFTTIGATTPFVTGITMVPASPVVDEEVTITLTGNNIPSAVYLLVDGSITSTAYAVTNGTISAQFTKAATFNLQVSNGKSAAGLELPPSKSLYVTVQAKPTPVTMTLSALGVQEKGKQFTANWTAVTGATYLLRVSYLDNSASSNLRSTTNSVEVPGSVINKIGRYYATVETEGLATQVVSNIVYFDVTDASYKTTTGKAKANNTKTYDTAGTTHVNAVVLNKDDQVNIIGELGDYYHIRIGTVGTDAQRLFVLKTDITKSGSSSSGGSSGSGSGGGSSSGSGSGGSTGTRPGAGGTSITTTAYNDAFGSESLRKSSYAYIPTLYDQLVIDLADPEKTDITPFTEKEILTLNFSPLPLELNSDQYAQVRERAAWTLVTAVMTKIVKDAATTEMMAESNALQQIAGKVSAVIEEVLAQQDVAFDESVQKVLTEVKQKADEVVSSQMMQRLTGTQEEVVTSVLERLIAADKYDVEVIKALFAAETKLISSGEKTADDLAAEPIEIQYMRVLYALSDYEESRVTAALASLPASAMIAEINAVQDTYLDYVFAVAKLHQMSFAYGGAKEHSDLVVQNWGAEIARLIAINKVYNTFAQE